MWYVLHGMEHVVLFFECQVSVADFNFTWVLDCETYLCGTFAVYVHEAHTTYCSRADSPNNIPSKTDVPDVLTCCSFNNGRLTARLRS